MNTNYEIMNYLNLTNPRLGKLYKLTGYNPLPADFVFDEKTIKDRLYLNQMSSFVQLPSFIYEDKKIVKKYYKNSVKNLKKILKSIYNNKNKEKIDKNFSIKLESYLDIRLEVTKLILKEFNKYDFDERESCQEIYDIDPIFAVLLEDIFVDNVDIEKLFSNLENNYEIAYLDKMKLIEIKNNQKIAKKVQNIENIKNTKYIKKSKKIGKTQEKYIISSKKVDNLNKFSKVDGLEKHEEIKNADKIKEK